MRLFLPIGRKEPDSEADRVLDDWIPGYHPILDIFALMRTLAHNQVNLAKAQVRAMRLWLALAILWAILATLNLLPHLLGH